MISEYDNIQNPMLGAYILWSFVRGFFLERNELIPIEELFIVLPMIMKPDIAELIKSTNRTSGMRTMSDKFMNTNVLRNDLICELNNDIDKMKELTVVSFAEAIKAGLISIDKNSNMIYPLEIDRRKKETSNIKQMGKNAEKLGQWCSDMSLVQIEEILKVRF